MVLGPLAVIAAFPSSALSAAPLAVPVAIGTVGN
jgi:hypothetical protein